MRTIYANNRKINTPRILFYLRIQYTYKLSSTSAIEADDDADDEDDDVDETSLSVIFHTSIDYSKYKI